MEIVQTCSTQLQNVPGKEDQQICFKIGNVLKKQRFQILLGLQKMQSGNKDRHISTNCSPNMTSNMKFSPMTFVDIKRFFNLYKHILSNRRTHMTPENMKQSIVINYFKRDT